MAIDINKLNSISDCDLISGLTNLVKIERETTLQILEYLSEMDRRRLWLKEGYSSLFDFCVRHLKYSDGETARRIQASRTLNKFEEEVRPVLEKDELSLTSLCLLSPHLTKENILPILETAKNKSTREVEVIIKQAFPETAFKPKLFSVELDDELEMLLELTKRQLSEKVPQVILKRVLKEFLRVRKTRNSITKKHTRYVPVQLQRETRNEAQNKCSYVAPTGVGCNQTTHLQIDHIRPWAKGGSSHDKNNLRLLCRAHNLMLAKNDFPEK
jgi:hypothetical protein